LGAALFNLNQLEAAAEQARRALELDGNYARAYALLGRVHTEQKDWRLAEEAYQTALRLDGQDRDTWYFLGRCYYEENRFKPALEAFQRALSLKAEYSRTYENLALTYEALSQYGAAEKAYRRAIELAGSHYRPFFAYGVFLYKQMRTEESLLMLQKSVQADPNAAEARFRLGTVLLRMGRLEAAAAQTERALDLARECRFRYQLIRIYIQQGRMAEADEQARQIRGCETHR
jgi:tetratricopeptide (TPR) repeat protein